jgi:hypothetical protein
MSTYATVVVKANEQAILSEAGAKLDRSILDAWTEKNGPGGFFVQEVVDPETEQVSPMDRQLLTSEQFHQLYEFEKGDIEVMFRRVFAKQ